MLRILGSRNFVFPFSIVLGLLLGEKAGWAKPFILPLLGLVMAVSTTEIPTSVFLQFRQLVRATALTIVFNYLILGSVTLVLARWLMPDEPLWVGFVLFVAAPPAVAVVPFTVVLGGNKALALLSTFGGYLASLALAPLITLLLLGGNIIPAAKLFWVLAELVIIPFVISRLILFVGFEKRLEDYRGTIVNWSFAIVVCAVVGLNRDVLVQEPSVFLLTLLVGFVAPFLIGWAIDTTTKRLAIPEPDRKTLILMGTLKNSGFSAAVALSLVGARAAIPSTMTSIFLTLYFLFLDFRFRKGTHA